jgi:uncharacterized coiled-coil DUF342 family protein
MIMQIRSIILYNPDGRTRSINFHLGKVNIITGKSSAGKSTVIDIIDYCSGRSDFRIPEGPIRESVAWYAVLYQIGETQVFIAKPKPEDNASSLSQLYFEAGASIPMPSLEQLRINSTDAAVNEYLTRLLGVSPNINIPEEGQTRAPIEASLKHTKYYLFQKQSVIANQDVLFHRQSEPFVPQAIKDTLPYFLGAIQEDRLKIVQEYRTVKRDLKLFEKRLEESEGIVTNEAHTAQMLFSECQQVGLVDANLLPSNPAHLLEILRGCLNWTPSKNNIAENDLVPSLQTKRDNVKNALYEKSDQIKVAESFADESEGYSKEANVQKQRLESIKLFSNTNHSTGTCPLCNNKLENAVPAIEDINKSLQSLSQSLQNVNRERPKLNEYVQKLKDEHSDIRKELLSIENEISALQNENEESKRLRDENSRRAKIVGKVSLYLDSIKSSSEISPLRSQIKSLKDKIEEYERLLDPQEIEDRKASIESMLSKDMSEWAGTLNLEHKGCPYRFDIDKLTVIADKNGRPVIMGKTLGGGENWLGCHIITLLALHKFFIAENRPVPNFLILDQPTQVYFKPDKYKALEGLKGELKDEDTLAVDRLYAFLFSFCEKLNGAMQIIVLDHANLDNQKFQDSLVEEPWRQKNALVPFDWIENN